MRKHLILIPLVMCFIQSCGPAALPAAETQGPPVASPVPSTPTMPAAALTQTAAPIQPSATPTLAACMPAKGSVEIERITTDLLPEPLQYHIYLPPCYDEETGSRYPVLYLIHGKNATDSQWVDLGVPDTLNRLVPKGELPPFLVVMPRDRVWYDPEVDKFGQALVESLVPWVDEHYRTLPERKYRAIGGLSRGGAWAIHIGFAHPELFGAVGLHSSYEFNTDVIAIDRWLKNFPEGMTPRVYIDIGDDDRPDITLLTTSVERKLTKYGIPHEWHLYDGGHEAYYWLMHVEEYLRWYSQDWGSN